MVVKDGQGPVAIEWVNLEQKKRKVLGFARAAAHAPVANGVEERDSAPIARCRRSYSTVLPRSGPRSIDMSAAVSRGVHTGATWRL